MSYTVSQGDLFDETYDGQNVNGVRTSESIALFFSVGPDDLHSDGLGKLTDGILAQDDCWVGWKKGNTSVQLTFYFLQHQNFSSIRFYLSLIHI